MTDSRLARLGDLLSAATPAQLTALADHDLWRHARPGVAADFDADRFGEWLEALVDAGEAIAASTVASLDKDLVILGLSRYVRVFDPGVFQPTAQSDDEPPVRQIALDECEVAGYVVHGRRLDAWDAIVTLLLALETDHAEYLHAVMQGCRRLSNSLPEVDGLDDLLPAADQHLYGVASAREQRRSEQGYATTGDARAFLQLARQPKHANRAVVSSPSTPHSDGLALVPERDARFARLRHLMAQVLDHDESLYLARTRELALLANTLFAGCSFQSRAFTPQEASDAAAATCNLGLEYWPASDAWLRDHDLVMAFELGWSVLHEQVGLFAADQLIAALVDLYCIDDDIQEGLVALHRALVRHRAAGTPWKARDAAEVLGMLDMAASISVIGLLDECPVVTAALTAVLHRSTTRVSATAFEFMSTPAQVADVRLFLRQLRDVLSR